MQPSSFGQRRTGNSSQKQIFVGKLGGELWESEKNDLSGAISTGILGKGGTRGFLGSSVAT
jgi:hypothetical protein